MAVIRPLAQFVLDVNKIQTEFLVTLYRRFGLYRKIYEACGLSEAAASRLEKNMLAGILQGAADQHQVFSRWVGGTTDLVEMVAEYATWFEEYLSHCGNIAVEATAHAD